MDFDAIVVGSGISGGWVAKELCERGLKTLVIERGRHVEHRDRLPGFRDALGGAASRPGAAGRDRRALRDPEPVLRLQLGDQTMVGARQRASLRHAGGPAVLLDPRLSPRRPLAHLGAPDLSHERLSTSTPTSSTATASTGRSVIRIFRRGTTASNDSPASPARTKVSSSCPTGSSCRRSSSTASSSSSSAAPRRAIRRAA